MSEILNRNLRLLQKHQPHVYNKMIEYINGRYTPQNNVIERILLARHGDLIINMLVVCNGKEYLMCDHEDPIGQSYVWIDKYVDPSNKADIVFGIGMGFHLEVLITSFKNKKIIVVEPNIELFYQILQIRNFELIIEKSELFVDEDVDSILARVYALFWDTEKGGIQCQPFEVYADIFGNLWDDLRMKFIKQAENFNVDIATRRHFGEQWVYNNIMNAERIGEASNAGGLVGKFSGVPGILVSAGPSLEKNVHLLKDIKDKCVIMAAGTAVNLLEGFGITPHFMVGVDAGETEAQRHKKVKSDDIYFIYSNQVATGSVEGYKGPKFFMNYPVDRYTAEFLKFTDIRSELFFSGPTVSNTCFDILLKMGCNPIILIGQDLSYTGGKLYADGKWGNNLDDIDEAEKQGFILRKDIYGNDVYTRPQFIVMKNWFEGYFEKVKTKVDIINATEGGLEIQFAKNDTLANAISGFKTNDQNVQQRIDAVFEECTFPKNINEKLVEYKEFIASEISKLEEYSKKQMKLVDLIKRDIYHPSKDKKAFEKIVDRVGELTDRVMESPIYKTLLSNLVEMDFYLLKMEVDRAIKELSRYEDVKEIYINAIKQQNSKLSEKLEFVKRVLEESKK